MSNEVYSFYEGTLKITPEGSTESILAYVENVDVAKVYNTVPELNTATPRILSLTTNISIGSLWYDDTQEDIFELKKPCTVVIEWVNNDTRTKTDTVENVLFTDLGKSGGQDNFVMRNDLKGQAIIYY